jgi:hypothetical protein
MLRASLRRDDARARDGDAATTSRGGRRGRDNERRDGDDAPELGALDALPRDVRIHALSFCAADALATLARMGFGEDAARAAERRARRRGAEETPRRESGCGGTIKMFQRSWRWRTKTRRRRRRGMGEREREAAGPRRTTTR